MDDQHADAQISDAYPTGQLAAAFVTALTHEDAETRRRAEERVRAWRQVLAGMAEGRIDVGSRTPVAGWPAWVTPEVVRGGFATGEPAAGGPLHPYEIEAAGRAGITPDREALFLHYLTDAGLAELDELLDSGRYEVGVPEESALLTVAWLLRAGDRVAALDLVRELTPFAGRLRFTPRPAEVPRVESAVVHRATVGEVRDRLRRRQPNAAVETMREALTVWAPFADELLAHWLETVRDGRVATFEPAGWRQRSVELLRRYERLAAAHPRCGKHRRPRENLAILRTALDELIATDSRAPRRRGLLQCAVDAMVRRRGTPGTRAHARLRERQVADAARPSLYALAQVVAARLASRPPDAGLPGLDDVLAPVTEAEEARTGVPARTAVPEPLAKVVRRALAAPVSELIDAGVVTSAEVLAELIPQLVAAASTAAYPDPALRRLMAATYTAFSNRRSLLLLNLQHQVRRDELPWVRAVEPYRRPTGDTRAAARTALADLGELAVQAWPGTILPNPLVRELGELAKQAGLDVPLTEELAADIFMGTFSGKFLQAAKIAADLLEGSPYARYYGIDYAAVRALDDTAAHPEYAARTSEGFAALCSARADLAGRSGGSAAANGMVIEQAQILTTHNLATLVHTLGVRPVAGWPDLTRGAFTTACRLAARIRNNPRPLRTIKDTAYAWRQMLFFLSLCAPADRATLITWLDDHLATRPGHVRTRLEAYVAGLRQVLADDDARPPEPFLGWRTGGRRVAS